MSEPVPVILSARRTPIGRYLGALAGFSAVELGVHAARAAIADSGVAPSWIEECIVGNVLSAGLGQAPARQVALGSEVPPGASALTVNMVCGSGLRAVMLAEASIRAGDASFMLAGGIESMSNAPHLLFGGRAGWKYGDRPLIDSIQKDGLTCAREGWPMGKAAEHTAQAFFLTRAELDQYAMRSHERACKAMADGAFRDEIVRLARETRNGREEVVEQDETPRADCTLASLAKLAPAFQVDGIVTAGNASALSDGAAMLVVAEKAAAERIGAKPLARILGSAVAGTEPRDLFVAPVLAIRKLLIRTNVNIEDVELFEINEAFASQMIACMRELNIDPENVNIHGGAIALGHPIGASGARVLVTLLHALARTGKRIGLASLCLGGGNAVAMLVERLD